MGVVGYGIPGTWYVQNVFFSCVLAIKYETRLLETRRVRDLPTVVFGVSWCTFDLKI